MLLILAGVSISMLTGENGILKQASDAKTQTEEKSMIEQIQLAYLSALTEENGKVDFGVLNEELEKLGFDRGTETDGVYSNDIKELPAEVEIDGKTYEIDVNGNVTLKGNGGGVTIPVVTDVSQLTTAVTEKTIYKDTTSVNTTTKQAVIPEGFKVSSESTEQNIDTGLVVIAPDGSEFVWVPVDDINSMVMCQGSTGANDCNITKQGEELVCKTHSKDICGKLYATSVGENIDSKLKTQKYTKDSGLREPDLVTSFDNNTTYNNGLFTADSLQDEYEDMAKSVYENKGFYVGRYETGIEEGKTVSKNAYENTQVTTATAASANMWYGLYQIEKDYNKKEYDDEGNTLEEIVGSTMIWGSQYDQMMIWMEKNGYTVTSTNSAKLKGAVQNESQTTGNSSYNDILNNVYDIWGCNYEWTLEASNTFFRVRRGGYYHSSLSPSYRDHSLPYNIDSNNSSRVSLYIK